MNQNNNNSKLKNNPYHQYRLNHEDLHMKLELFKEGSGIYQH